MVTECMFQIYSTRRQDREREGDDYPLLVSAPFDYLLRIISRSPKSTIIKRWCLFIGLGEFFQSPPIPYINMQC